MAEKTIQITAGREVADRNQIHFGQRVSDVKVFLIIWQNLDGNVQRKQSLFLLADWREDTYQYAVARFAFNKIIFADNSGHQIRGHDWRAIESNRAQIIAQTFFGRDRHI